MADEVITLAGRRVLVCDPDGPVVRGEVEAVDLLGSTWGQEVDWLVLPTARLAQEFLSLRTGVAGAVTQKMVTYGMRLAIVGDISAEVAASDALRDYVRESNAGRHVWFVPDMATLEARFEATS